MSGGAYTDLSEEDRRWAANTHDEVSSYLSCACTGQLELEGSSVSSGREKLLQVLALWAVAPAHGYPALRKHER
jgi:hypothetical protein